jgi:hypothetical protein
VFTNPKKYSRPANPVNQIFRVPFFGESGGGYPVFGVFQTWQCFVNLPLYSLGQNSRNEKYIHASITGWNLHLLENYIVRRVQEEAVAPRRIGGGRKD